MKSKIQFILTATLIIGLLSLFLSCATILHGTKQDVSIGSSPKQAEVVVKTFGGIVVFTGKTPAIVKLKRKEEYDVFINLAGYKEERVYISRSFDSIFLGNLFCGGIFGFLIDAVDGAMYKLEPEVINVSLVTVSIGNGACETYAVFRALDSEGQLRTLVIPLIRF